MFFMQTYCGSDETMLFRKIVHTLYLLILICIQIHQESKRKNTFHQQINFYLQLSSYKNSYLGH